MVCKRVYYSGRVQGVGFRYTTHGLAGNFAVTGHVRNLPNGDVEVIAEGLAEEVDGFLEVVARRMAGYIEKTQVEDIPCVGCKDFSIRH